MGEVLPGEKEPNMDDRFGFFMSKIGNYDTYKKLHL